MASQDYPLITDPHAPTHLPQTADSTTADYYAHSAFTTNENSDADKSVSGSGSGSKRNPYYYKKQKTGNTSETASDYRVDYRKDREEWSDTAIACLLEAYTEKFNQLNRGNLRGRDWEEVAEAVSERCGGSYNGDNSNSSNDKQQQQKAWKSVEQCKNKIDNLKKRYKVELQRMNSSGSASSNWHWFKQIEAIMGNINNNSNLVNKSIVAETEERSGGAAASPIAVSPLTRQAKRCMPFYNISV